MFSPFPSRALNVVIIVVLNCFLIVLMWLILILVPLQWRLCTNKAIGENITSWNNSHTLNIIVLIHLHILAAGYTISSWVHCSCLFLWWCGWLAAVAHSLCPAMRVCTIYHYHGKRSKFKIWNMVCTRWILLLHHCKVKHTHTHTHTHTQEAISQTIVSWGLSISKSGSIKCFAS
jgi:hypothetical protein